MWMFQLEKGQREKDYQIGQKTTNLLKGKGGGASSGGEGEFFHTGRSTWRVQIRKKIMKTDQRDN